MDPVLDAEQVSPGPEPDGAALTVSLHTGESRLSGRR